MGLSDFVETTPEKDNTKWQNAEEAPSSEPSSSLTTQTQSQPTTAPPVVTSPSAPTTDSTSAVPTVDSIAASLSGLLTGIGQNSNLKMMVFGDPGSTKTSFAATAPNLLAFDLEDGFLSAKSGPHGVGEGFKRIPWTDFETFQKFIYVLKNGAFPEFKTVAIDTLTELHKKILQDVMTEAHSRTPSINRYLPQTEHYTEANRRLETIIRALRELNRNLILICHAKTVEPKGKPAKTYADFSESLSNNVMKFMDTVGYFEMRKVDMKPVPVMRVVSDGTVNCKTRFPLGGEEVVDPTFPQIYREWEKWKNKE